MAVKPAILPELPAELRALQLYLLKRDVGPPAGTLGPIAIVQTSVGGPMLDTIAWDLVPDPQNPERAPDGFVVWWENAATGDPSQGGVRLSASARSFSMLWPSGDRSYAIAAFRNTYQGEELGPKVQHSTWGGATGGTGGGGLEVDEDSASVVATATALDFIEPDFTLVSESPAGTARLAMDEYARLEGRAGGQTVNGGVVDGENLTLNPNSGAAQDGFIAIMDLLLAYFTKNSNALVKLALGGDFIEAFIPGGLWQVMIQADGVDPSLALAAFNSVGGCELNALAFTGSPAAPGVIAGGQQILVFGGTTLDGDGNFIGPCCGFAFAVHGDPGTGFSPTNLVFFTTHEVGLTRQIEFDNNAHFRLPIGQAPTTNAYVGGVIFDDREGAGSVGTGETDLIITTIESYVLEGFGGIGMISGSKIRARYAGVCENSASTKRLRLYIATIQIFDSGAMTITGTGTCHWDLEVVVMRATNNSTSPPGFKASARLVVSNVTGQTTVVYTDLNFDPTVDQTLKVTGTAAGGAAANDDVVAKFGTVEYLPLNPR